MAAIPSVPLFMRDVKLTLKAAADATPLEFQCHVSEARVQVTPGDTVSVQTLCANGSFSSTGKPSYALILNGYQDWDTTSNSEGLAEWLWKHEGEVCDFNLQAHGELVTASASKPVMLGQVVAHGVDYGGAINEYAPFEAELACVAKPTLSTTGTMEDEPEAEPEAKRKVA
jgi:hypothetical protein